MLAAEKLTRWYRGKQAYRVPVLVKFNDSRQCGTVAELRLSVTALSVVDAVNFVRDAVQHRPETEVIAFGPKGGKVYRYVGWFSAIGNALCAPASTGPVQARLNFEVSE